MNRPLVLIGAVVLAVCLGSCGSADTPAPPDTRYYDSEVLPESLIGVYGTWTYGGTQGGGVNRPPDFDVLRLLPYGGFDCLTDGDIVRFGRIETWADFGLPLALRFIVEDGTSQDEWPLMLYDSARGTPLHVSLWEGENHLRGMMLGPNWPDADNFVFNTRD
jgi:hypothetical protein